MRDLVNEASQRLWLVFLDGEKNQYSCLSWEIPTQIQGVTNRQLKYKVASSFDSKEHTEKERPEGLSDTDVRDREPVIEGKPQTSTLPTGLPAEKLETLTLGSFREH